METYRHAEKPSDEDGPIDMRPEAAGARVASVWKLTVDEYARRGIDITKIALDRSAVRKIRLQDDDQDYTSKTSD